jgi:CheY-like chemotaxis protein
MPSCDGLPIFAVTAIVDAGERRRCIAAGASGYVSKPVDTDELLLTLGRWLPPAVPATEALDGNP